MPLWIALGMAAAALLWSHATRPPDEPKPSTREYVRTQLGATDGVRMVLPVELPAGYDYPTMYNYDTWQSADDAADTTRPKRADSRSVVFFPTGDSTKVRPPIVIICVQPVNLKHEICPSGTDSRHLQLRHEQTRVTIYAANKGRYDMSPWQHVALTTDLNKVNWLH